MVSGFVFIQLKWWSWMQISVDQQSLQTFLYIS